MVAETAQFTSLNNRAWRSLLRDIHAGQVLPVIGPELVTIQIPDSHEITLQNYLASELAKCLDIDLKPDTPVTLNEVACSWLLSGESSKDLYDELRELVDNLNLPPPQALLDLASITDFNLYISSTFDPLLGLALQEKRPGFRTQVNISDFHPSNPRDLPHPLPSPFLFHILGTHDTYPDFVIWEEDYIEYIFGLLRSQDNLRLLFDQLRNRDLLLIGSPFTDWIVRLFLRVVKDKRFSVPRDQGRKDYIADDPSNITRPTIFFFEQEIGSTRIIPGDPRQFVAELSSQWSARYSATTEGDILDLMGNDMPRGSVFISYSHDDRAAAIQLASGLTSARIPVWLDRKRLSAGENYERSLEHAVKNDASFFISLISEATELRPDRYVHKERAWAAERHVDGYVFYIPVLIEELNDVQQEPSVFSKIHREILPGGEISAPFARRLQDLVEEHRATGQPRG